MTSGDGIPSASKTPTLPGQIVLVMARCTTVMHLVEINAEPLEGETNSREYDFTKTTIEARWHAGYTDTRRMIAKRPWENKIDPEVGVAVYASDAL